MTSGPSGCPELLTVQIAQGPRDLLHFLPRGDPGADLRLERLRDVEGVRAAGRAAEAQREMGAMLRPGLTVAPRPATAPVGLGESAEHDLPGKLVKPAEEGGARPRACRHRCHQ